MKSEILNLVRLPARLTVQQAAELLGFMEHDIPMLVRAGLLKPLGKPAANGPKYFAACELSAFAEDRSWLDRASKAISDHWRRRHATHAVAAD